MYAATVYNDCIYTCLNFKAEVLIVSGTRQPDCVWCLHRESAYFSFRPVEDRIQRHGATPSELP